MTETTWYYESADGKTLGPVSTEALQEVFAVGSLPLSTPVMAAGTEQWVAARMIPEFRKVAAAEVSEERTQVPPPTPLPAHELEYATLGMAAVTRDPQTPSLGARWFARQIDHLVLLGPTILLMYAMVAFFGQDVSPLVWVLVCVVARLILEAALLAGYGATPGKKAMGIGVETHEGLRPSFGQALQRAALVLVGGEGLSLPGVGLVAQLVAYGMARGEGVSFWDRQLDLRLRRRPAAAGQVLGVPLLVMGVLIVGVVILVEILAANLNKPYVEPSYAAIEKKHQEWVLRRRWQSGPSWELAPPAPVRTAADDARDAEFLRNVKLLSGEWQRTAQYPSQPVTHVLVLKEDGSFRAYARISSSDVARAPLNAADRGVGHGPRSTFTRKPLDLPPVGEWSGKWQLDAWRLTLDVQTTTTRGLPTGAWRFELQSARETGLTLQPLSFPYGTAIPPRDQQDTWEFRRNAPSAVAHTE